MSSKCQPSDNPADVFVRLFDQIPESLFLGDEVEELSGEDAVWQESSAVEQAVLRDGRAAPTLADLPEDSSRNRFALARLIGLDRILFRVNPRAEASPPPSLMWLAARYARKGHFNDQTPGLLLPRLVNYGAPRHRPDKYETFSVIRVEPDRINNIQYKALGSRGWPTAKGKDDVIVACLPFLDEVDDVSLERVDKASGGRYRLGPSENDRLKQRVDKAIAALDNSGAVIGLLPEGSLSSTLLDVWKDRLAKTYPGSRSRLALVVAGTGPVTGERLPRNRAVVLDRQGNPIWEQDKLCDYTLVEKYVRDWQLPGLGDGDLLEDIRRGDDLVVAETSLGRLAILICEDLSRCGDRRVTPRELGVSHIMNPVFDAPLEKHGWERYAAERYVRSIGSRVAVSNSRVVGHLQGKKSTIVTALGVSPLPAQSWDYDVQDGATKSATQAVCVHLRAVGPPMLDPDD